ncbi:MAG: serine/threonine-protein phosphatase [Candidatus Hydrogenedentota bacterium]|nr:MAG: serine/threonine-protein phosphatase [Candidatus Hydrogenedentota bacterium]
MGSAATFRFAGLTDIGRVRKNNEDAFKIASLGDDRWVAVADGCGGEAAGEVASSRALEVFEEEISREVQTERDLAFVLRDAVVRANEVLLEEAQGERKGMATTFSALYFRKDLAYSLHVGDSRIYRLQEDRFELLTCDHTWVEYAVQAGRITREEAEHHERAGWLMQALGMAEFRAPDIDFFPVKVGDRFLLCSDGLQKCVSDEEIAQALATGDEPERTCRYLIDQSLARGAPDNVTVVVVYVEGEG